MPKVDFTSYHHVFRYGKYMFIFGLCVYFYIYGNLGAIIIRPRTNSSSDDYIAEPEKSRDVISENILKNVKNKSTVFDNIPNVSTLVNNTSMPTTFSPNSNITTDIPEIKNTAQKSPTQIPQISVNPIAKSIENPSLPAGRSKGFTPTLLWWNKMRGKKTPFVKTHLINKKCRAKCNYVNNRSLASESHAIFFHGWNLDLKTKAESINGSSVHKPHDIPNIRHNSQYYIFLLSEAPARTNVHLEAYRDFFNWTVTYRMDSDFPMPEGQFARKNSSYKLDRQLSKRPQLVAWLVSNCFHTPSNRSQLVQNLQQHIPVSIYGKCGNLTCQSSNCYKEIAQTHKFYLSFENSYCKDYVTEKFFDALNAKMVPVVYGNVDYETRFPPGSFINVDSFKTPKELAEYLLYLDQNDEDYLKYFEWRQQYDVISGRQYRSIFCNVCERVHQDYLIKNSVVDVNDWFFGSKNNNSSNNNSICTTPRIKF